MLHTADIGSIAHDSLKEKIFLCLLIKADEPDLLETKLNIQGPADGREPAFSGAACQRGRKRRILLPDFTLGRRT
jgi:hypothetical protein